MQHEGAARATLEKLAKEERASLVTEGMKFHTAPDAKGYLKLAVDSAYARMTGRLTKAKRDAAHVATLRKLFIR